VQLLKNQQKVQLSYTQFAISGIAIMQFLHSGLGAGFALSPGGNFCPQAKRQISHSGQAEIIAPRPASVQKMHTGRMQKLHFSCVQKMHVILINDS